MNRARAFHSKKAEKDTERRRLLKAQLKNHETAAARNIQMSGASAAKSKNATAMAVADTNELLSIQWPLGATVDGKTFVEVSNVILDIGSPLDPKYTWLLILLRGLNKVSSWILLESYVRKLLAA